jgi:sialic acid synthase SpsE
MKFKIENKTIGDNFPCFIVAEAGINHNGSLKIAKEMISKAKQSGVDAIKFQTFKADDLATPKSPYYKIFKKVELKFDDFKKLADFAKRKKIIFFSTPFSEESVEVLSKINVPMFKISSGDLTHLPLLMHTA